MRRYSVISSVLALAVGALLIGIAVSWGIRVSQSSRMGDVRDHDEISHPIEVALASGDALRVRAGETGQLVYRITNNTGAPLTLDDVRTSCTCTVPDARTFALEPGEQRQVAIDFQTLDYERGKKPVEAVFLFSGSHVQNRLYRVKATALILAGLTVSPAILRVSDMKAGQAHETRVRCMFDSNDITIGSVRATTKGLSFSSPQPGYLTVVFREPELPPGRVVTGELNVVCAAPEVGSFQIPYLIERVVE